METLHSCISRKDFTNFEGNPYAGDGDVTLLATSEARGWQVMIIWWWFALFWWPSLSGWTLKVNPLLKKKLKLLQKWCFKVPLGKPTRGQRGLEEGGSWPNLLSKELHKDKVAQKDGLIMQPCFLSRIVTEYEDCRTSKQLAVSCNETSGIMTPNRNVCPHQSQEQAPKGPALLCTSSPLWRALHGSTDAKRSRDQVKLLCKTWQSRLITLLEPHCKSQHSRLTRLLDCKTARLLHCYHTSLLFFRCASISWIGYDPYQGIIFSWDISNLIKGIQTINLKNWGGSDLTPFMVSLRT